MSNAGKPRNPSRATRGAVQAGSGQARGPDGASRGAPSTADPARYALGYGRVSTEDQATNGYGLDAQRSTVEAEGARRGYTVRWSADLGASGKHVNPKLRGALETLAAGRADALIVAKLDRLARSVAHAAEIMERARKQGWNLIICDLAVDLATPQGEAMANMLATFAQFERRMIGVRTREGLAAAKLRGTRLGAPRLAPVAVVERIVRDRDAGASFGEIARALTGAAVLSPAGRTTWQPSTVRRIFYAASRES